MEGEDERRSGGKGMDRSSGRGAEWWAEGLRDGGGRGAENKKKREGG